MAILQQLSGVKLRRAVSRYETGKVLVAQSLNEGLARRRSERHSLTSSGNGRRYYNVLCLIRLETGILCLGDICLAKGGQSRPTLHHVHISTCLIVEVDRCVHGAVALGSGGGRGVQPPGKAIDIRKFGRPHLVHGAVAIFPFARLLGESSALLRGLDLWLEWVAL